MPPAARALIEDDGVDRRLSAAVIWEVAIKRALGKLTARPDFHELLYKQGVIGLPVYDRHAARVAELPQRHGDPFDRLLVAQALDEGMSILSADPLLRQYDVSVVW